MKPTLIVLGPQDCLMFGSCGKKNDRQEGRVFCRPNHRWRRDMEVCLLYRQMGRAGFLALKPEPTDKNMRDKNMPARSPFFCLQSFCHLLLTLVFVTVSHAAERPAGKLNIVLILADDVGWGDFQCTTTSPSVRRC